MRRPQLEDARTKIIQKNRAKIRDVRDLISSKKKPADARYVITKNMSERLSKVAVIPGRVRKLPRTPMPDPYMLALDDLIPPPLQYNPHKYHHHPHHLPLEPQRRGYVDYDAIEDTQPLDSRGGASYDALFQNYVSAKQTTTPPTATVYKPSAAALIDDEDAFDLYDAPARNRRPLPPPPSSSSSSSANPRRFVPNEETHLSYEMRARLEGQSAKAPPRSMGIFANPTKSMTSERHSTTRGYRVMVTNLHSSVTVWDIQELFGDIGGLISAEIVKPGVAEVVYKTVKDAEDAVEVYHNRQLDGQPMKCHLITPPPTTLPGKVAGPAAARRPPLELDMETIHSALFTNKRH